MYRRRESTPPNAPANYRDLPVLERHAICSGIRRPRLSWDTDDISLQGPADVSVASSLGGHLEEMQIDTVSPVRQSSDSQESDDQSIVPKMHLRARCLKMRYISSLSPSEPVVRWIFDEEDRPTSYLPTAVISSYLSWEEFQEGAIPEEEPYQDEGFLAWEYLQKDTDEICPGLEPMRAEIEGAQQIFVNLKQLPRVSDTEVWGRQKMVHQLRGEPWLPGLSVGWECRGDVTSPAFVMKDFSIDIRHRVPTKPCPLFESEIRRMLHHRLNVDSVMWDFPFVILNIASWVNVPGLGSLPLTIVGALTIWTESHKGYRDGFSLGTPWIEEKSPSEGLRSLLRQSPLEKRRWKSLRGFARRLQAQHIGKEERVALFLAVTTFPHCISISKLLWCWLVEVPTPPENSSWDPLVIALAEKL